MDELSAFKGPPASLLEREKECLGYLMLAFSHYRGSLGNESRFYCRCWCQNRIKR